MQIARIFVSNFLGAAAVDLRTDAKVQLFAGRNGAGKSSLRDAVALALTADLGRVSLKKDAGHLVHAGADAAVCEVETTDGDSYHVTITAAGKIADSQKGRETDPVLAYVLDAQRFARLDETARRAFLFGLMGMKQDPGAIRERLVGRGCDKAKVERIAPMLRSGFESASKEAKAKATEAKGAWRALTGETFGSEKAKTWRASVPKHDAAAARQVATELQHIDVAIEQWQQSIGRLQAQEQRRDTLRAKLPALQEHATKIPRITAKLQLDEQQLSDWEADLAKTAAAAGAGPRVGIVHRLARAVAMAVPVWPNQDQVNSGWQELREALAEYEAEHGPALTTAGDEKARDRLPNVQRSRDLMASSVANDRRDLEAARQAKASAEKITSELAETFEAAELEQARDQVQQLRAQRADLVKRADALKVAKDAADAAEQKTSAAAGYAADVAAWDAIGDALAPDGIPGEILSEALGPMNARLASSAIDTDWLHVAVGADMSITGGGRDYRLLSESERWRVDAMLAEAVAHLSGTRLLVLDRFDVLDPAGRAQLIGWLEVLAETGEIDTALVFGTLKAIPTGLPSTITAHWLENGVVGQLKKAA